MKIRLDDEPWQPVEDLLALLEYFLGIPLREEYVPEDDDG